MRVKKLTDLKIVIEPDYDLGRYLKTEQQRIDAYERWAKELQEFIRDHRSQDGCIITVERVCEDVCEFCGREWENIIDPDTGEPLCCGQAQEEWARVHAEQEAPDAEADS